MSTKAEDDKAELKESNGIEIQVAGESLSSLASSCLLSLVIAWGVTPKILQALERLITVTRPLAAQRITVSTVFMKKVF